MSATKQNDPPEYEWILCETPPTPSAPLLKIGTLTKAKNRQFEIVRNRAGSLSFQLRTDDDLAYEILDQVDLNDVRGTVRKCVRLRRNKVDLWSGPIWGIDGSLDQGTMDISCVGWLEWLQHRVIRSVLDYSGGGYGTRTDLIVSGVLQALAAQDPGYPAAVQMGTPTGTMPNRNRYYQQGTVVGQAFQELSEIESGIDYEVDPITRELNLFSWDSYQDRKDVILGYNWGPRNLKSFGWREDASKTCNSMVVVSQGAPVGPVVDGASLLEYGQFQEWNTISGANQSVLAPYGEAELVVRSRPMLTYTVVPFPNASPKLFDDFTIGDKIYFTAIRNAFKLKNQAIRVFGASVSLDDAGNETVGSIMTAPDTG